MSSYFTCDRDHTPWQLFPLTSQNAEFRKKILTPKSKKYKPVKKYSGWAHFFVTLFLISICHAFNDAFLSPPFHPPPPSPPPSPPTPVIMPQRHRPGKKSSVLIKGRKRSASASPAVRRTRCEFLFVSSRKVPLNYRLMAIFHCPQLHLLWAPLMISSHGCWRSSLSCIYLRRPFMICGRRALAKWSRCRKQRKIWRGRRANSRSR